MTDCTRQARVHELETIRGTLERELSNVDAVAASRVRDAESQRDAAEFAAKQAKDRATTLDQWRTREAERAARAEQDAENARLDLHKMRAEVKTAQQQVQLRAVPSPPKTKFNRGKNLVRAMIELKYDTAHL